MKCYRTSGIKLLTIIILLFTTVHWLQTCFISTLSILTKYSLKIRSVCRDLDSVYWFRASSLLSFLLPFLLLLLRPRSLSITSLTLQKMSSEHGIWMHEATINVLVAGIGWWQCEASKQSGAGKTTQRICLPALPGFHPTCCVLVALRTCEAVTVTNQPTNLRMDHLLNHHFIISPLVLT